MAQILIDVERGKYPYSGLGFFCACLRAGLDELSGQLLLDHRLLYYGDGADALCRHYALHRFFNPYVYGKDLIHITHQLQDYFPNNSGQARYVLTLHDLNFLYEDLSPAQRQRRLRKVRHNLERADVIVCISHFVRKSLEEHIGLFRLKPQLKIEVIHNGLRLVDKMALPPPLGRNMASLSGLEGQRYLLSIGVLQEKKQQHLLIEMLCSLPQDIGLVLLYSAGRADYISRLYGLVEYLGLQGRVHFYCQVSAQEKQQFINGAWAYVHPSLAEGFGIPPIEAMWAGRPVFLSRLTSLPEIGGQEAYYFEDLSPQAMAETLLRGMADYDSQPDKPYRLHQWAERYDYLRMARDYLSLYNRLLS